MKKIIFAGIAAILFTAANTVFAAAYGAEAVKENTSYSTEQMLTFALQDEYKARTLYRLVNETMQAPRPFINTEQAEAFQKISVCIQCFWNRSFRTISDPYSAI